MQTSQPAGRIQQVMKRLQLTQKQLSEILGISQPAVSLYLQGRMPPADILYRIARLGHTSVEWLLSGNETAQAAAVSEKPAVYGNDTVLLELWSELSLALQKDILNLLRHILENC